MSLEINPLENEESERFFKEIKTENEYLKDYAVFELVEGGRFSPEQTVELKNLSQKHFSIRGKTFYGSKYVVFSLPGSEDTLKICFANDRTKYHMFMWAHLKWEFGEDIILKGGGYHNIQDEEHFTEKEPSIGMTEKGILTREQFDACRKQILDMDIGITSWEEFLGI